MARFLDPETGNIYEEDENGELRLVEDRDYYLRQQAQETSAPMAALVSTGAELSRIGRGAQNLFGGDATLDENAAAALQALQGESPIAAGIGAALPYLATAPLGAAPALGADVALGGIGGYSERDPLEALQGAAFAGATGALPFAAPYLRRGYGAVRERMADRAANMIRAQADELRKVNAATRAEAKAQAATGRAAVVFIASVEPGPSGQSTADRLFAYGDDAEGVTGALDEMDVSSSAYHQDLVDIADASGWKLTAAQRANNRGTEAAESFMRDMPGVRGVYDEMAEENQRLAAREFAGAFGVRSDELNPATLGQMRDKVNREFASVQRAIPTIKNMDMPFWDGLDEIEAVSGRSLTGKAFAEKDLPQIRESLSQPNITGREIMDLRREAMTKYKNTSAANDPDARYWRETVELLDEQIERSAGPELAARYSKVRTQWRLLDALETNAAINARGEVNWPTLYRAMRRNFPREMTYDNPGRLFRLVKVGRRFGPSGASSGTAERSAIYRALDVAGSLARKGYTAAKETAGRE